MTVFWVGIAGEATSDQCQTLCEAGMRYRGKGGKKRNSGMTEVHSYFLVEAETEEKAIFRIGEALPELQAVWAETPPHVIGVEED